MQSKFYREKGKKIWNVNSEEEGPFYFTFDKKKIYNFWTDYWNLTNEQRSLFDREYPGKACLKNPDVECPNYPDDDDDAEVEYEYSN